MNGRPREQVIIDSVIAERDALRADLAKAHAALEALLRKVVDLTWGHALEDRSVPSSKIATKLIDRARAVLEGEEK